MSAEPTTPRPWMPQSRDDGQSDPWWIDTHAYPDGPQPVWAPPQYPVSEADVTMICEAVNAYDRLRAIEAAARAMVEEGEVECSDPDCQAKALRLSQLVVALRDPADPMSDPLHNLDDTARTDSHK